MNLKQKMYSKLEIGIIISFFVTIIMYFVVSIYFINHFYFKTTINCINVSGKTVDEADKELSSQTDSYKLILEGKQGTKDEITADEINLQYNSSNKIQELKNNQNALKWIYGFFYSEDKKIPELVSYDYDKLNYVVNNLNCINSSDITEAKNPSLEYKDNEYVIVNEICGDKINKDILYEIIINAIKNGEKKINLDENNCYESSKYNSKSKEVVDAKEILNKCISSKITYNFNDETEVVDISIIKNWLDIDENYNVSVNKTKVEDYVNTLANKCNTVGRTRNFITTDGSTISVSGGDYGWKIDTLEETNYLINSIKEGKIESKTPKYVQTAVCGEDNDIGNTYVEINMSKQYLWFYKDGKIITDGSVVTGNMSNGNKTPTGTYKLDYKEKNATLKGENYKTHVDFWMPFNGGIGIHDAIWRESFGGNIYITNGSHGCVNAPYSLASIIFNNIDSGTPIVCYY